MDTTLNLKSADSYITIITIVLFQIFFEWITLLSELYTFLRYVVHRFFVKLISYPCKFWVTSLTWKTELLHENVDSESVKKKLSVGEVRMIMEKLETLSHDVDPYQSIEVLFEEEPSREEVKEAFDVFDENDDGFIDSRELKKVLCSTGFMQASDLECKRMVKAFDNNGDGRIDFDEFVILLEKSFG